MKILNLNFYNHSVCISSPQDLEVISLLAKDFSAFKSNTESTSKNQFTLEICNQVPPWNQVPKTSASMQTLNSICYDVGKFRYCDYYSELLVILDKKMNHARLYSENTQRMHEVSYLLTLSRVGKKMDLAGLHKLHAFSVSFNDIAIVCMMPMKGGKSTLLMEFLKDSRFKMISDDIPLINFKGEILPFPIKIGLSQFPESLDIHNPEENLYTMDRGFYGVKQLLCVEGIPGRVEEPGKVFRKIILVESFRFNSEISQLKKTNILSTYIGLMKHGVIGFGLPMVIEYFWENGPVDFMIKTKIFFLRAFGFGALALRAQKMKLHLGKNPNDAAKLLIDHVLKYAQEIS
ncbi:MAG: hypothetical protein HOP07_08830 [Bacteriovoracaceae bacterium]|nr:hypothetical protein [Bacteriovoracaceae bacterium]